ncbi:hypothetical protein SAY87_029786 [Trapa incisa]|uniref:Uncharacterized protein n=1 Tax=Trapa incisa TaxID=236973 RepID=A0AAN7KDK3_9MYRT|nr:hypothetical protein SAY87_029786 [Trapa incisa]
MLTKCSPEKYKVVATQPVAPSLSLSLSVRREFDVTSPSTCHSRSEEEDTLGDSGLSQIKTHSFHLFQIQILPGFLSPVRYSLYTLRSSILLPSNSLPHCCHKF